MTDHQKNILYRVVEAHIIFFVIGLLILGAVKLVHGQTVERPSVTPCSHEPHAHQDEDLRIRMSVRITGSDPCGFGWETTHEVGRLEFCPETSVTSTTVVPTGGSTTIITVRDVRKGRTALVVFCSFCKSAIYVGLNTEVTK